MKALICLSILAAVVAVSAATWRNAAPGWSYAFPRDHRVHPDFATEWWYFTGNLDGPDRHRFGYELTFFRQGILPMQERAEHPSRFVVGDLKFAHFTVTDANGRKFFFDQKASRGAFGEAGFSEGEQIASIEDWSLRQTGDAQFELRAATAACRIALTLMSEKPAAIHSIDGVSRKGAAPENASHYYSLTQMRTTGTITIGEAAHDIAGLSWFDHEWASNQLGQEQVGWDWLCVQLADGRELMLYRMRLRDGSVDPASSGTLIERDGATSHLEARDFEMTATRRWKSDRTGTDYPVEWAVRLPGRDVTLRVTPVIDPQELALNPLTYWEGAVDVSGTERGRGVTGRGYLELTGYAAPLRALQR